MTLSQYLQSRLIKQAFVAAARGRLHLAAEPIDRSSGR
jgi:hypothetical protein